ncbi:MAG: RNA pseudouridine synthase [Bacteroidetes bacterium]|nr:RNA pseudouridine synthase [Bacteroidota bacterium]
MKIRSLEPLILFEDENLIAINKPAMISSLQDRWAETMSIQSLAEAYCETAQLCHRLDKETSGVLLIAKNPETYREVAQGFSKRQIDKTYWAVLEGRHYFDAFEVEVPLATSARGKAKVDFREGKPALTRLKTLENFRHFTLAECKPVTGRLHQIRIHCATVKAPLMSDTVYGGKLHYLSELKRNFNQGKDREPRPMIERTALHAKAIQLTLYDKIIQVEAPLPKDFDVLLTLLRKYDYT